MQQRQDIKLPSRSINTVIIIPFSQWVCPNAVAKQLKEHVALLVYNTAQPLK